MDIGDRAVTVGKRKPGHNAHGSGNTTAAIERVVFRYYWLNWPRVALFGRVQYSKSAFAAREGMERCECVLHLIIETASNVKTRTEAKSCGYKLQFRKMGSSIRWRDYRERGA